MKSRILCIAMCACLTLLSACSTPQRVAQPPIQQNLLVKCPKELPQLSDGTAGTVLQTMVQWASTYHQCAARHSGLVDAVKARE